MLEAPLFRGPWRFARKFTLLRPKLAEVAVLDSVASLVDISVNNISLDTLPENRITSASAIRNLRRRVSFMAANGAMARNCPSVTPQPEQIFEQETQP